MGRRPTASGNPAPTHRGNSTCGDTYAAGATDFLNVLTIQKELLAAQEALAGSTTDVSLSLVGLYKALGGGWETTFPARATTPAEGHEPDVDMPAIDHLAIARNLPVPFIVEKSLHGH